MMDVVGHNIANVNTAGYKSSVITFQEALSQVLNGAGAPSVGTAGNGGTNPLQIGLGTRIGTIEGVFTQGASQVTGRNLDLALQGDGFFVLEGEAGRFYSRVGNFSLDANGSLVAPGGLKVMGWMADATGTIASTTPISPIDLPLGVVIDPRTTTLVETGGNLPADAPVGDAATSSITIYDSLGAPHELIVTFTKSAANTWDMAAEIDGTAATLSSSSLVFDSAGALTGATTINVSGVTPPGADPLAFDIELGGATPLVQYGGGASVEANSQNGAAIGFLREFAVGLDGTITGQFSNGETKIMARISTAVFGNPGGLQRVGESRFVATINSGEPLIDEPGSGNHGQVAGGTLEMSNVDLALEFTNLIIAQRGFQANSRVITTSDDVLNELVNLKR
jgi:flagellar hook protein FlgE